MGSKGGGSAPTESTVTQTNLPEYAEPFYRDLLARVGYESAIPYETYQGSRLQYFSPAEQEAMRRFEQLGVSGTPDELMAAGDIAAQVGTGNPYAETMLEVTRRAQEMPGYASQFQQGNVYTGYDPRAATTQNLQAYMSPYQQLVVDREKQEAMRQSQIMGQNIGLQAAGTGSLGGYREAIMQAERQRNLEDQLGDIQTAGSQRAFEMARSGFDAYQQARQQAAQMGLSAQQQEQAGRIAEEQARRAAVQMNLGQAQTAAQLGQSAYAQLLGGEQQRLAAAGMLGDFTAQRQAQEMERLRAMQAAGQIQRELLQRGLDIGYADFLRQQAFPKEQLAFYSSMLQGIPIAPGTVSQSYGVGPSTTQQLLGSGIAGVGLYNALMG
jgi:hypothetical protein